MSHYPLPAVALAYRLGPAGLDGSRAGVDGDGDGIVLSVIALITAACCTAICGEAASAACAACASAVRVPSHRLGPPETLTVVLYGNLIRAPDRLVGKRDHALLMLGDCGLRNAELRSVIARP